MVSTSIESAARAAELAGKAGDRPNEVITMDGKILNSEGQYVAYIRESKIYNPAGRKLYDLRAKKIYKPTGELVGHLNSADGDRRLDKSTDRLFPKV